MKRFFTAIIIAGTVLLSVNQSQAQAWSKDTKVLAFGIGGSQFFHIYPHTTYYGYGYYGSGFRSFNSPLTGQFNFQGEFGVHEYVGVGFITGVGGRAGYYYGFYNSYGSAGEVTVPIGAIANFHFYQLIADKTGKDIKSDKLDVYAGVKIGSGIAAQFWNDGSTRIIPIAFGGVQAGARYYFTEKFGVNLEVGYPNLVNGGIVLKL